MVVEEIECQAAARYAKSIPVGRMEGSAVDTAFFFAKTGFFLFYMYTIHILVETLT